MIRILLTGLLVSLASVSAQTPEQFKQMAVQRTAELGQCHAELGPLQQLSAQVLAGRLLTLESLRQQVEAANPGQTLNDKLVIVAKPAAPKPLPMP